MRYQIVDQMPSGGESGRLTKVVAVAQTSPLLGQKDANLARAEEMIEAVAGSADVIIFPELFTTGYNLDALDLAALADPLPDGRASRRLADAARHAQVAVVGSMLEEADGDLYDTAVAFDRSGRLAGRHRKSHLYPTEHAQFEAGHELAVVDLDGLRVGLAICFENAFPEIFGALAMAGAEMVAIPSAVPVGYEYLLELRTRARAQDNQVFVAGANLAGDDGQTEWCGGSLIADPRGSILAAAGTGRDIVIQTRIDLAMIERERAQEPIWASRRPEMYSDLTQRPGVVPPER